MFRSNSLQGLVSTAVDGVVDAKGKDLLWKKEGRKRELRKDLCLRKRITHYVDECSGQCYALNNVYRGGDVTFSRPIHQHKEHSLTMNRSQDILSLESCFKAP